MDRLQLNLALHPWEHLDAAKPLCHQCEVQHSLSNAGDTEGAGRGRSTALSSFLPEGGMGLGSKGRRCWTACSHCWPPLVPTW